jgi:pyruvate ferredoxin oxidoreductase alpha subunit
LNPDLPKSMGCFAMPEIYTETKMAHDVALRNARQVIDQVWEEWARLTGRRYSAVDTYRCDDADTVFLTMGSFGETASMAVDALRQQGVKAGLVKLRLWRPFPVEDVRAILGRFQHVVVIDRALSFGGMGGPLAIEVRAALYGQPNAPFLSDVVCGLGGRDVAVTDFLKIFQHAVGERASGQAGVYHLYGVRG